MTKVTQKRGLVGRWIVPGLATFVAVLGFAATPANAVKIGSWDAVCMAPNWKTGEVQPVRFTRTPHRGRNYWYAKTERLDDGRWHIDFNTTFIKRTDTSEMVQIYIFYHECAHARLNTTRERPADCEALRMMRASMTVTPMMLREIGFAYGQLRRMFPTGGPCEPPEKHPEVLAQTREWPNLVLEGRAED